jgi:hypothetical protein
MVALQSRSTQPVPAASSTSNLPAGEVLQTGSVDDQRPLVLDEDTAAISDSWRLPRYPIVFLTKYADVFSILAKGLNPDGGNKQGTMLSILDINDAGELPVNVRGDGIDCVIVLDTALMLHDGIRMTLSDNGTTIFTEDHIPVRHIKRVSRLNEPKHTLYFRQTCERLRFAPHGLLKCIECLALHPVGTQWCPTSCGVPLTPWGVSDRIALYARKADRHGELLHYGWTPKEFEEVRKKENGPSVNALKVKRRADGVVPDMRQAKVRKMKITAPKASSVVSERVNAPAAAAHCTVPVAHLVPAADVEATLGGRSRAELQALCEQKGIKDGFIRKREAGARPNEEYKSHTDRYRQDHAYRAQCQKHGVPEWLVNSSGEIVRIDGQRGDELRGAT